MFLVELEEVDSMTGLNQERTGEQVFRTAATASGRAGLADKAQYSLSYHWDGRRTDLSTVDIVFSKSLLNNPNCLEFIKVTGTEARVTTGRSSNNNKLAPPISLCRAIDYYWRDYILTPVHISGTLCYCRAPAVRRREDQGPRSPVSLSHTASPASGDCRPGLSSQLALLLFLGRCQRIITPLLPPLLPGCELPRPPVFPHHGPAQRRPEQDCQSGKVAAALPDGLHYPQRPRHGLRSVQLRAGVCWRWQSCGLPQLPPAAAPGRPAGLCAAAGELCADPQLQHGRQTNVRSQHKQRGHRGLSPGLL